MRRKDWKLILFGFLILFSPLFLGFFVDHPITLPTSEPASSALSEMSSSTILSLISSWTISEVVSTESSRESHAPQLTIDKSGNIHVVWYDILSSEYTVFYKRWDAGINAWTGSEIISSESVADSRFPEIATDPFGNIHVIWYSKSDELESGPDYDIFYRCWDASMGTWNPIELVSAESDSSSFASSIAVDAAGNIHVAWYDNTDLAGAGWDSDIFYKKKIFSTGIWTPTEVVSTQSTKNTGQPSIGVDKTGNVHIAWWEVASGGDNVFYRYWDVASGSWGQTELVSSESVSDSKYPSLAVDDVGNIHVTWEDFSDYQGAGTDSDIFYKCRTADTNSWTFTEVVSTESTSTSRLPSIALDDSGQPYIVWDEWVRSEYDIFFKAKDAQTDQWSLIELISTESNKYSTAPAISIDGINQVHVTWMDETNYSNSGSDWDIFYKIGIPTLQDPPPPQAPTLNPIEPNPVTDGIIHLNWSTVANATEYYIYRATSPITAVEGMTPIATVTTTSYQDIIHTNGTYHYGIVASNAFGNSSLSNCELVEVAIPSYPWGWTQTEVVSTESTDFSHNPSIAVDGSGNVHVAWCDLTDYGGSGSDYDVFYKRWNASRGNWTLTEVLSTESTNCSFYPKIVVDRAENVHVTWRDATFYGSGWLYDGIFYKCWNASTDIWTLTEVIHINNTYQSTPSSISVDEAGNLQVAWCELTDYGSSGLNYNVFYKRWNASMGNWTLTEVIYTERRSTNYYPTIVLDNSGSVHVAWVDWSTYPGRYYKDLLYKRWNASTQIWSTTEVLSTENTAHAEDPTIGVDDDGNIHLLWCNFSQNGLIVEYRDQNILYRCYNATTGSWTPIEVVAATNATVPERWIRKEGDREEIFYINASTGFYGSSIAVDRGGNVHVACYNSTYMCGLEEEDIFYTCRNASLGIWTALEVISDDSPYLNNSVSPTIAVGDDGSVHVVWRDKSNYCGCGMDADIFYKKLTRGMNEGFEPHPPPQDPTSSLRTPVLGAIMPNPNLNGNIALNWSAVGGASTYYVYRNTSNITSIAGLTPIANTPANHYQESICNNGIYYFAIVASNATGNSSLSNCESVVVAFPPIEPTIEWKVPGDLDFEINLGVSRECTIAFNFENTGNATFLNLNFTIDLPLGWSAESNTVSIVRLAPQESASLLFRIIPLDSRDEFLEILSIDFEASILETGETYGDAITIIVAGKGTDDFIIWGIIVIGSVSGVASANCVVFRRRRKKHRIRALLHLTMNAPKGSHAEVPESAVGEDTDSTELFEDAPVRGPPAIAPAQLLKVLNGILESFPSLARQFPRAAHVKFLMEEVRYPYDELLPFISSLLASVSVSELRTQVCVRMNALRGSHDEGNVMQVLDEIDALLYWAESTNDRPLLNDLLQLLLLIEYSRGGY